MISLIRAQEVAETIVKRLQPFCVRIEIAGSIRRQRPEVDDIDLVIEAHDRVALERRVLERCTRVKSGEQYLEARMADGTQLDLWFAHTPHEFGRKDLFSDPLPDNFGSLLLCRTGSKFHNITLCNRAKRLGRHWNPHWGVYQDGKCIASRTEADIYLALGLEFIEPADREFTTNAEQLRLINRPQLQTA